MWQLNLQTLWYYPTSLIPWLQCSVFMVFKTIAQFKSWWTNNLVIMWYLMLQILFLDLIRNRYEWIKYPYCNIFYSTYCNKTVGGVSFYTLLLWFLGLKIRRKGQFVKLNVCLLKVSLLVKCTMFTYLIFNVNRTAIVNQKKSNICMVLQSSHAQCCLSNLIKNMTYK